MNKLLLCKLVCDKVRLWSSNCWTLRLVSNEIISGVLEINGENVMKFMMMLGVGFHGWPERRPLRCLVHTAVSLDSRVITPISAANLREI